MTDTHLTHPAASNTVLKHLYRRIFTFALIAAGPSFIIGSAQAALKCTIQPSCASLGYTQTDTENCESYLYCPFDTSYKKCVSVPVEEDNPCDIKTYDDLITNVGNVLCPVITLKNNIDASDIDDGQTFALSANQTLDGAGYSLNLNNQSFTMDKNAKITNIHLSWKALDQNAITINDSNVTISDININLQDYTKSVFQVATGSLFIEGTNIIDLSGNLGYSAVIATSKGELSLVSDASLDINMHDADSRCPSGIKIAQTTNIDGTLNIFYDHCPNTDSGIHVGGELTINGTTNITISSAFNGTSVNGGMYVSSGNSPIINGSLNITLDNIRPSNSRWSIDGLHGWGGDIFTINSSGTVTINQKNISGLRSVLGVDLNLLDIKGKLIVNQNDIDTSETVIGMVGSGYGADDYLGVRIYGNVTISQNKINSPNTYFIASESSIGKRTIRFPSSTATLTTSTSDRRYSSSDAGINIGVVEATKGARWILQSNGYNRTWTCSSSYTNTGISASSVPPSTYWK